MSRNEIIQYLILRSIGNFMVLFAVFGVIATFGPAVLYESQYRIAQLRGVRYVVHDTTNPQPTTSPFGEILKKQRERQGTAEPSGLAQVLTGPKEQILIPKDTEFNILIPKLGANAQVIPNIDPEKESEYLPALLKGVAHAKGSVFPGLKGTTYLFAHSADNFWDVGRYNALFYLLKDLEVKDDVVVFFENKRHNYQVTDSRIVDPEDVSYLLRSQQSGEEQLVLQTCWPPGTTWKRLVVVAKPKK